MARLEGWAEEIFNGSGWRQAYYRRGQQVSCARHENPLKCHHFMDKCTTRNMSSGRILSGVHAKWMWRDRMGVGWRSCLETHGRSWGFWFNNCNHNLEQVGKCLLVGDGYDGGKLSGDMTYLYPGFTIGIVGQYQGGHLRAGREAVLVKHRISE